MIRALLIGLVIALSIAPTSASATECTDASSGTATAVPDWVNTTLLGNQPAGYELWAPEGPIRGVMIGIHGGGWETTGAASLSVLHYQAEQWIARGFAFANFDYRICGDSLPDVETLHDALRALVPDVPFCVLGESAGAHLALLLAADRPDSISCVIAGAPPANADLLAQSNANLAAIWQDAFGPEWNTTYNPAARVDDIKARVLMGVSTGDTIINPEQITTLEGPNREALVLDGQANGWYYPHANITGPAHDLYESHVAALIAPYTGSYVVPWGRPAPPPPPPAPEPPPTVAPTPTPAPTIPAPAHTRKVAKVTIRRVVRRGRWNVVYGRSSVHGRVTIRDTMRHRVAGRGRVAHGRFRVRVPRATKAVYRARVRTLRSAPYRITRL